MTIRMTTPTFQCFSVPIPVKLAAAWTSMMFLYFYVDYLLLYKPGIVDGLRGGVIFDLSISPALLTVFFAVVAVPAVMAVLSVTLPPQVNRATNLVVATLYIPVTAFNAVGESWEWAPFYAFSIALELLLLAFILRSAWRWPRTNGAATDRADSSVRRSAS